MTRIRSIPTTMLLVLLALNLTPLPARDRTGGAVRILPLVFSGREDVGSVFTTTFSLINLTATTIEVQVVAFAEGVESSIIDSDSGPVAAAVIRLLPNQAVRRSLRRSDSEIFPVRRAWLLFRGPAGGFAASARISNLQVSPPGGNADGPPDVEMPDVNRRVRSDVQIDAFPPASDLAALITWDGTRPCAPTSISAYSLVNPGRQATTVDFRFVRYLDNDNRVVHEARREIPASTRISVLLTELFPELFPRKDQAACARVHARGAGTLEVSAEHPVNMGALSVNLVTGHFVDLPVRIVRQGAAAETDTR